MQYIYDTMVWFGLMAFFFAGGWTGPVWQMVLVGLGSLGLVVVGAYLGGYILGTKRHQDANYRKVKRGGKRI